jgi:predicted acylesterase/phospholipase RssA
LKTREQVDVVVAGGASHVVALAGALATLSQRVDIVRVGGASAGAISAAAEAFAVSAMIQRSLMSRVLTHNYLKDQSFWPLTRYGIYAGDNLLKALKEVFGEQRMGEALIPLRIMVCDLWTRHPVVIDSMNPEHAKLHVVDVLRCSAAIPVFFKAWTLPEWRGNRLFVDGGTAANFALGMFDDIPERRTIGLRLKAEPLDDVRPVKDLASFAEAIATLVLWASDNAYISKKRFADVIQIPQLGSGLDFDLPVPLVNQRWEAGVDAVTEAQFAMGLLK